MQIPGIELFFAGIHPLGGPAPVRRFLPDLIQLIWDRKIDPGKVFDLTLPLEQAAEGYQAMDERTPPRCCSRYESDVPHQNDADRSAHGHPDRAARRRMWPGRRESDDQSGADLDSTTQSPPMPGPSRSPAGDGADDRRRRRQKSGPLPRRLSLEGQSEGARTPGGLGYYAPATFSFSTTGTSPTSPASSSLAE